jgi:hypothetical protein
VRRQPADRDGDCTRRRDHAIPGYGP